MRINSLKESIYIVLTTYPNEESSQEIVELILSKKIAACVQIIPKIQSYYWWKDQIQNSWEQLLVIKTFGKHLNALELIINQNHPYDVPEFVCIETNKVSLNYEKWMGHEIN